MFYEIHGGSHSFRFTNELSGMRDFGGYTVGSFPRDFARIQTAGIDEPQYHGLHIDCGKPVAPSAMACPHCGSTDFTGSKREAERVAREVATREAAAEARRAEEDRKWLARHAASEAEIDARWEALSWLQQYWIWNPYSVLAAIGTGLGCFGSAILVPCIIWFHLITHWLKWFWVWGPLLFFGSLLLRQSGEERLSGSSPAVDAMVLLLLFVPVALYAWWLIFSPRYRREWDLSSDHGLGLKGAPSFWYVPMVIVPLLVFFLALSINNIVND